MTTYCIHLRFGVCLQTVALNGSESNLSEAADLVGIDCSACQQGCTQQALALDSSMAAVYTSPRAKPTLLDLCHKISLLQKRHRVLIELDHDKSVFNGVKVHVSPC